MRDKPHRYQTLAVLVGLALALLVIGRPPGLTASSRARGHNVPNAVWRGKQSDPSNLLTNPGFEDGFYSYNDIPELRVANVWAPWWVQGTDPLYNVRPEWKDEWIWGPSIRVMHGEFAHKFFTSFSTHTAGFYQRVAVPQDALLEFSIWVQVWSSDCDVICVSPLEPCRTGSDNSHGKYGISIGIDPFGNVPGEDGAGAPETVLWSPEQVVYDDWVQLRITAQAQADHVTVYTRGRPQWPVKHNDSYWDAAKLLIHGDETETPTSTITVTPSATSTTAVTLTPSVTPTSSATPTPSATATPSATPTPTHTATWSVTPTSSATPTPKATSTPGPLDKLSYLPLIVRNLPALVATPTSTTTSTPTPTTTSTGTPAVTATLSPTPTGVCSDIVSNGGFEGEGGWTLGQTLRPPSVTAEQVHSGSRSLRLGITAPDDDVETWSFAWQQITLPVDAARATLSFWIYPLSDDAGVGDWQEAILRDADGVPLRFIMFPVRSNGQTWERRTFDLTPYVGQALQLWFNVYNNGSGGVTAMYLDDVALEVCRGAVALARPRVHTSTVSTSDGVIGITWIRYSPDQLRLGADCDRPDVDWRIEFLQTEVFTGTVDLTGWTLSDGVNPPFVFPPLVRQHGERVRVWSRGSLPDSPTDLYWNRPAPVWDNDLGIAILSQADGTVRSKFCYGPGVWGPCPDVWPPPTTTPTVGNAISYRQ